MFILNKDRKRWVRLRPKFVQVVWHSSTERQVLVTDEDGSKYSIGNPSSSSKDIVDALKELGIETSDHDVCQMTIERPKPRITTL